MAQPTFKAVGTAYQGQGDAHSVQGDVSPAAGDFLLLAIPMSGGSSFTAVATPSAGDNWIALPGGLSGTPGHFDVSVESGATTAMKLALFYKIATGSEPSSYSFATVNSLNTGARIYSWQGQDTSTPFGGVTPVWSGYAAGSRSIIEFRNASNSPAAGNLANLTTDHRIIRVGIGHSGTTATTLSAIDGDHTLRGQHVPPNQARTVGVMDVGVATAGVDPASAYAEGNYGLNSTVALNGTVGVSFAIKGAGGAPEAPTEDLVPSGSITTRTGLPNGAITDIDDPPDPALDDGAYLTAASTPDGTAGSPTTHPAQDPNTPSLAVTGFTSTTLTSEANIFDTSDSTAATHAPGTNNVDYGRYFQFPAADFSAIPSDATINSIAVRVRAGASNANRLSLWIQAMTANGGTVIGQEGQTDGGTAIPTTVQDYGANLSPAMNAVPTRAQLVSGTFGLRLRWRRSNTVTLSLYRIQVTVNYTTAGTPGATVATEVIVPLSDPSTITPDAAADGTLAMLVKKRGNGVTGGNPTVIGELREGTTVRGSISSQAVSGEHRFTALVDQSTITDWTNLNFRMRSDGVSGGLVELGAARFTVVGEADEGDTTAPAAPSGLVATDGSGQVSLDWTTHPDPDGDLAGYNVYRSTSEFGTYTKVNGTLAPFSDYVDTVAGGTYWYKVTAVDTSSNESGFSNADSGVSSAPGATCVSRRIGALTDDGFTVAGQFSGATTVALRVSANSDLSSPVGDFSAAAPDAQSYTKATATGLSANTQYYYGWVLNGSLVGAGTGDGRGQAKTKPANGAATSFNVVVASCSDHTPSTRSNGAVFTAIRDANPLMMFHMGDMHYGDPDTADADVHRNWFETQIGNANQQSLYSRIPVGYIYSDHDFSGNNSSGSTSGTNSAGADTAPVVHRQIMPHYPHLADYDNPGAGTRSDQCVDYVTQIGRVHFFHMDTRTDSSDRNATDGPTKTKLGSAQKARLLAWASHASRKTLPKVILTQEAFHDTPSDTGDGWTNYDDEQTSIINQFATDGVTNVIWVGGDMHALAYQDSGPGGFPCYQAAPLGASTSEKAGPWDAIYPSNASTGVEGAQFGWLAFTDSGGSSITVQFTGRDSSGATVLTAPTHTFTNVVATTRIAKDLQLQWNVAARITKDFQAQWNVQSRITKDLVLQWNVQQRINKDLALQWNVQTRVSKDLQLQWDVAAITATRITKDLVLQWNVAQRITKDIQLQWQVATRITKDVNLPWTVARRIDKDINLQWVTQGPKDTEVRLTFPTPPRPLIEGADLQEFRIEARKVGTGPNPRLTALLFEDGVQLATPRLNAPLSDTAGEIFPATWDAALLSDITGADVELVVRITGGTDAWGELVDVEWNALHEGTPSSRVEKDLNLQWRVIGRTTQDLELQWGIATRITQDLNLQWQVAARTSKDLELQWRVVRRIDKDLNLQWSVKERITKDLELQWDVQGVVITRITKDLALQWNVAQRISKDLALQWNVAQRISADLQLQWQVKQRITQELQAQWQTKERISKDLGLSWQVKERVTKDLQLQWNVADVPGRVSQDLVLQWSVKERISKDLTLQWGVSTRTNKDLQLQWQVKERISKDLQLQWGVSTRITKDLVLQWDVAGLVLTRITKDLTLQWRVIGRITKDLNLVWEVKTEELSVIIKGYVKPKIQVKGQVAPKIKTTWRVSPKIRVAGKVRDKIHVRGG